MIILLIISSIYGISVLYNKIWLHKAYSNDGIYRLNWPTSQDKYVYYLPVYNTLLTIGFIFRGSPLKQKPK